MAGNSQRRGAVRKAGTKKGPTVGSGGVRRRGLEGKGATPPAHERPHHPAAKRAAKAARSAQGRQKKTDDTEIVLGRNPVVECLRAGVPATALYVALGAESDERLTESVTRAADSGIPILEVSRTDLDRMSSNGLHQGIGLQVPPYQYMHPDDMLKAATTDSMPAMLVALDNISAPRNLGAIVRSVAAFAGPRSWTEKQFGTFFADVIADGVLEPRHGRVEGVGRKDLVAVGNAVDVERICGKAEKTGGLGL